MRNKDVIECFLSKKIGNTEHLHSTGDKLISYNTCIVQWDNDKFIVNNTKYSTTSSIHLGLFKRRLGKQNYDLYVYKEVNNIPRNNLNLK